MSYFLDTISDCDIIKEIMTSSPIVFDQWSLQCLKLASGNQAYCSTNDDHGLDCVLFLSRKERLEPLNCPWERKGLTHNPVSVCENFLKMLLNSKD
jgi:hypothetical protein